jgi:hypothetical protein
VFRDCGLLRRGKKTSGEKAADDRLNPRKRQRNRKSRWSGEVHVQHGDPKKDKKEQPTQRTGNHGGPRTWAKLLGVKPIKKDAHHKNVNKREKMTPWQAFIFDPPLRDAI